MANKCGTLKDFLIEIPEISLNSQYLRKMNSCKQTSLASPSSKRSFFYSFTKSPPSPSNQSFTSQKKRSSSKAIKKPSFFSQAKLSQSEKLHGELMY